MPYTVLENFKNGMDARKLIEATLTSALPVLQNGFINNGGECEKIGSFPNIGTLPATTFGLFPGAYNSSGENTLITVGITDAGSISFPTAAPMVYHQITPSGGVSGLEKIYGISIFRGKIFVAAKFTVGGNQYFYNGTAIPTHPDTGGLSEVSVFAHKTKMYTGSGGFVYYSAISDATFWNPSPVAEEPTGAGFIEVSAYDADSNSVTGIAIYKGNVAFFFHRNIQIWFLSADDLENRHLQTLKNTGMVARKSLIQFGDNNAYYMSYDGIRTLRSRQVSDSFFAFDAGTPMDRYIFANQSAANRVATVSIVEPLSGRVWFNISDTAYVYTEYPSADIKAWHFYDLPAAVDYAAEANGVVYLRSGNALYRYDDAVYDDTEMVVRFPFLSGNKPGDKKFLGGIDIAARGTWTVRAYVDPLDDEQYIDLGELDDNTFSDGFDAGMGEATSFSLEFRTTSAMRAVLSSAAFYMSTGEERVQ